MALDTQSVGSEIRQAAAEEGFDLVGIAPAVDSAGFTDLANWIESGYAAQMNYFADRLDAYRHPAGVLPGAKSVIAMTLPYASDPTTANVAGQGRVARYAWQGSDYHDVIHPKLKRLAKLVRQLAPGSNARGVVDTAPIMEREIAQLAGLGWRGKNTLLINKHRGSYFFLACLLVDIELPYDAPHASDHCGTCTACLDACPTGAFPQPGVLDANKCISFLTIENRNQIAESLRPGIGDWVFGCDICQEVCPWNRKHAQASTAPIAEPSVDQLNSLELTNLFTLSDDDFRTRFRKTPLWRTRRRGILRNAAIVLGNQKHKLAIATLVRSIDDDDAVVRGAVAWALGQLADPIADAALRRRRERETDEMVRRELDHAIAKSS